MNEPRPLDALDEYRERLVKITHLEIGNRRLSLEDAIDLPPGDYEAVVVVGGVRREEPHEEDALEAFRHGPTPSVVVLEPEAFALAGPAALEWRGRVYRARSEFWEQSEAASRSESDQRYVGSCKRPASGV